MKVSAQYAASHLDDILSAVESGEEVHIDRPNKPGIRLVVDNAPNISAEPQTGRRILGAGRGQMRVPTVEEWAEMDKELVEQMLGDTEFEQPATRPSGRRHLFGAGKGLVTVPTDEQWDAMKKELAADMLDGPFFPPEND